MSKLKVLLVDDEQELIETLVERLEIRGIEAVAVTRGSKALEIIREQEFDVVVMDVKMPGIDGIKTTRQIKEIEPELQIILMTGRGSEQESMLSRQEGAFEYLIKPVNIDELIKTMKQAVSEKADKNE